MEQTGKDKLEQLAKLKSQVRIGGKGKPRRKKKVVSRSSGADDKKLQSTLKKLGANPIPGVEEVNMIKDAAALSANLFTISGNSETKPLMSMPDIFPQLGPEQIPLLKNMTNMSSLGVEELAKKVGAGGDAAAAAAAAAAGGDDDDQMP